MRASGSGRSGGMLALLLCAGLCGAASRATAGLERLTGAGDPGPTGLPQSQVFAPVEGPAGEVVFTSRLTALFRRAGEGVALVLGPGTTVPDGVVAGVGDTAVDDAGCAVALASLVGGGEGVYRICPAGITRILGTGDVTGGGVAISRLDFLTVVAAGPYVAVAARLADGADAVLRSDGVSLTEIARVGMPSPAGGVLTTLHVAGVRADGRVGMRAVVSGGHDGLFEGSGAALTTALVEGSATLVGLLDTITQASLSSAGVWAFIGSLDDGRAGVFRFDGTQTLPLVEALLLAGDPVPMRPGTTVRDFPTSVVPAVNASGDVAFRAVLGGTGSGAALFATRGSATPELLFSTRDSTELGLLSRLADPQLADDGSVLFSATPVRGGTGVFVYRGVLVSPLALFGDPTDLGRPDLPFRFVGGRVRATAEAAVLAAEHDTLVRRASDGILETLVDVGAPSPVGGRFADLGPAAIDGHGRVFFRGGVADASRGEGIFAAASGAVIDRVVTNDHVRGGPLRAVIETAVELGGDLAGSRRLIGFGALVGAGGSAQGLYALKGRHVRRLERSGRRLRHVGEIVSFGGRPALVGRRRYAFVAEIRDDTTRSAVVLRRGRRRRLAARAGPSPDSRLGGRLRAFTIPDASAQHVVFRATTDLGGAQGLFVDDWHATRLALATGEPDDAGGVLRGFERPVLAGENVVVAATSDLAGVSSEALVRFAAADVTGAAVVPETIVRAGDALPGGGLLADVLNVRGTARGAVLARVAVRDGPARQVLLRVADDLDPPQPSQ